MRTAFPFTAIVGQADMRRALTLAAIEPRLGGVLVVGDRGTGKTTAVRGLSALLPPIPVREGCRYNCEPKRPAPACPTCNAARPSKIIKRAAPVIDMPLGATEDRVVGALDLERALVAGEKVFEPGLLAAAHRGFLYVDEINLLDDHLVDLLLDVAASGECVVEREGLSVRHPARFVLVGSGNPEEGELRPQLLDRFGLSVDVTSPTVVAERIEVVRRREAFERDPDAFLAAWKRREGTERRLILAARERLDGVDVPDDTMEAIAAICIALGVDGLRGELTLMRAARALAALDGRDVATREDVAAMAVPSLRHRLRRDPLDASDGGARVERAVAGVLGAAGDEADGTASVGWNERGAPDATASDHPARTGAIPTGADPSAPGQSVREAWSARTASLQPPASYPASSRSTKSRSATSREPLARA